MRDQAQFTKPFLCRVGPRWWTRQIGPATGDTWANTFLESVLISDLRMQKIEMRMENPPMDLLIYNAPVAGASWEHLTYDDVPCRPQPQCLAYRWRGLPEGGQPVTFTTVLLPHPPSADAPAARDLAARIKTWRHDAQVTILSLGPFELRGLYPAETWWVVFNDTGATVSAGAVSTDAKVAVLVVRDGRVSQQWSLDQRPVTFQPGGATP